MAAATEVSTRLAYDIEGMGVPVVLLHGLTFDRRTWRPIVERLGGSVMSIAVDLPGHGESGGGPAPLEVVADRIHDLVTSLGVERPVVVGHSMAAGIAGLYAATYPVRGVVMVDQGPDVRPFAELVHQVGPALRSPAFAQVWQRFEESLGLELIPEPARSLVLDSHRVEQDVVVGYWETLLATDPAALQSMIDTQFAEADVPVFGIFGRPVSEHDRRSFARLPDAELEEWDGAGHFVHLVEADRFASRLRSFVNADPERRNP